MQEQEEGILTDEERAELANPIFEEPDPDAEEADPLTFEATDVAEGGIVDARDEIDDVFGQWPDPAPGAVRNEVL